jgi:hypothetical protein
MTATIPKTVETRPKHKARESLMETEKNVRKNEV